MTTTTTTEEASNPEIGQSIDTLGYATNYHDVGSGDPVLMLHGSGAGVTGWANWRGVMPGLSEQFRVIVPDLVGFGATETLEEFEFKIFETWRQQVIALLDGLGIDKVNIVGNSFGGGLALDLAIHHADRVGRFILMGAGGVDFEVGPELSKLWGYEPSIKAMKEILQVMAYDQSIATDELAELRYRATMRPGAMEAFQRVFPPPFQRHISAQTASEDDMRQIPHEVLILHGRDDRVVPFHVSARMFELIPKSQLHGFGECGHWTQIEHSRRFQMLVADFLAETER